MNIAKVALQFEKDFQDKTGSHWEIRNGVMKLLNKQKKELQERYITAHCNPDFKGYKHSFIFVDNA